ncbi:MAG: dihydropteroate synthase [Acidobacteria bacterium]|jgi:dihydropteroate synthase|nr:dihydropteroate synthase [Acidobacteriota bacterium]
MNDYWQTAKRKIAFREKTLLMAILNRTPDSFSDGGDFLSIDKALAQAEKFIEEGADIIDVGGESTRPLSEPVSAAEETRRVVPLVEAITQRFDVSVSVDTTKAEVAEKVLSAGAEIVNDISGLRFDAQIAEVAARFNAGLVLMHSRGDFASMHKQAPVEDIFAEIANSFRGAIKKAEGFGVKKENIALDVGIGFSKTFENNLELLAKLNRLADEFKDFPLLVGASRKSFIGKVLTDTQPSERLNGSLAAAAIAVWNGANIIRVHDVRATLETVKIIEAIKSEL